MDNGMCGSTVDNIFVFIMCLMIVGIGYFFQTNKWGKNIAAAGMFYFFGGGTALVLVGQCFLHIK